MVLNIPQEMNYMKDDLFLVDSNILVYAHDTSDIAKNKKSVKLLGECWIYIEFPVSFWRKSESRFILEFKNWIKITAKESTIIKAIELSEKYNTEYYDSLIAATMLENGISKIYTENVKDFIKIKEIGVINPFN